MAEGLILVRGIQKLDNGAFYHSAELEAFCKRFPEDWLTGVWKPKEYENVKRFMLVCGGKGELEWYAYSPKLRKCPEKKLPKKTFDQLLQLVHLVPNGNLDPTWFFLSGDNDLKLLPLAINFNGISNGKMLLNWYDVEESYNLEDAQMDEVTADELDYMRNRDPVLREYVKRLRLSSMERFFKTQEHTPEYERHLRLARARINKSRTLYEERALTGGDFNPIYRKVLEDMCDPLYVRQLFIAGKTDPRFTEEDVFYVNQWRKSSSSVSLS